MDQPDTSFDGLTRPGRRIGSTLPCHRPGGGREKTSDDRRHGGFTGPVFAQESDQLAFVHVQVDAGQHQVGIETFVDPAQREPRHGSPVEGFRRTIMGRMKVR